MSDGVPITFRWRSDQSQPAIFWNPWSNKSEWWPPKGDKLWSLLLSSRIRQNIRKVWMKENAMFSLWFGAEMTLSWDVHCFQIILWIKWSISSPFIFEAVFSTIFTWNNFGVHVLSLHIFQLNNSWKYPQIMWNKDPAKDKLLSEVHLEIFRNQIYFRFFPKYLNPRRKIIGKLVKIPWWGVPSRVSLLQINFMEPRVYQIIKVTNKRI